METIQGSEPRMPDPDKPYPVTVLGYPAPMIGPGGTYEKVSDQIGDIALKHPARPTGRSPRRLAPTAPLSLSSKQTQGFAWKRI